MAELDPPTPAFRQGPGGRLTTEIPPRLKRKGYIATTTAPREVTDVAGVPTDVTVPDATVALNSLTDSLYRRTSRGWRSVSGEV